MTGTAFPIGISAERGSGQGVQIDLDQRMLSIRYPTDVNGRGQCGDIAGVIAMLKRKKDRTWRKSLEKEI